MSDALSAGDSRRLIEVYSAPEEDAEGQHQRQAGEEEEAHA
jgi:hypothetical protein